MTRAGRPGTGPTTPVLVEAVRTPIGRRGGALAGLKAVQLLRHALVELLRRSDVEASSVQQVIGGCVTQIGEQSLNVTRNAWLDSGLDHTVGATTVDASCGSAQQANHLIVALIAAGVIDIGIACGVESMSRVPIGSNLRLGPGHYKTTDYPYDDPPGAQFGGAERIARREGLTRREVDAYGARSQDLAARAWDRGDYTAETVPIEVPIDDAVDRAGPTGARPAQTRTVARDEGLRETTPASLAALATTVPDGVHTAGTTSQLSDGAAALLWMSQARATEMGLRPRARLLHQVLVGADPFYLLDGPVAATRTLLGRAGMRLGDIDRYEVNEAFAAVVLAWERALRADRERLNVNGGAIALGHPLGATGSRLLVSAVHELERCDGELALVTMCCGGSMGTASLLERL